MKTLITAIIAAAILFPVIPARAGNQELRQRLVQAQQERNQQFQSIEQDANLSKAATREVRDPRPVSLADLSLPGRVIPNVLTSARILPENASGAEFCCAVQLKQPTLIRRSTPAAD